MMDAKLILPLDIEDRQSMERYLNQLTTLVNKLSSVEKLTITLSEPPTKAEVQKVVDKLNEILI